MNTRILLLALSVAAFSSCSVYRSGQTPDDVYYSPGRVQAQAGSGDDYVDVRQPKQGANYQSYEQYQDSYRDDRFLRMSIGNPYYLNAYNGYSGFDWRYNSFYNGFNYGFNSPWNNYFAWNNYYNPYSYYGSYGGGFYGGGHYSGGYGYGSGITYTRAPLSRPVVFNVNSYSNSNRPAGNRSYLNSYNNGQRYNNGNSNSGNRNSYYNNSGSNNRNSYTPSNSGNNNNNNNNYTPSRSYTPSSSGSSGSSSSGSSSSGGGGVSRPTRGN